MMDRLDFDFFFKQLVSGVFIDDTVFYFIDDSREDERYLGCMPQNTPSYWVGHCDIKGGCVFKTAEELVSAPIYEGLSLKERWDMVRIVSIEGLPLKEWFESLPC